MKSKHLIFSIPLTVLAFIFISYQVLAIAVDLSGFTVYGAGIVNTATTSTGTNMAKKNGVYNYKDYGSGNFTDSFDHRFTLLVSSITNGMAWNVWGFGSSVNTTYGIEQVNGQEVYITVNKASSPNIMYASLTIWSGTTDNHTGSDYIILPSLGTKYYFQVYADTTYSPDRIYMEVYTDPDYTTLLDSTYINYQAVISGQYLYIGQDLYKGIAGYSITYQVSDVVLSEQQTRPQYWDGSQWQDAWYNDVTGLYYYYDDDGNLWVWIDGAWLKVENLSQIPAEGADPNRPSASGPGGALVKLGTGTKDSLENTLSILHINDTPGKLGVSILISLLIYIYFEHNRQHNLAKICTGLALAFFTLIAWIPIAVSLASVVLVAIIVYYGGFNKLLRKKDA